MCIYYVCVCLHVRRLQHEAEMMVESYHPAEPLSLRFSFHISRQEKFHLTRSSLHVQSCGCTTSPGLTLHHVPDGADDSLGKGFPHVNHPSHKRKRLVQSWTFPGSIKRFNRMFNQTIQVFFFTLFEYIHSFVSVALWVICAYYYVSVRPTLTEMLLPHEELCCVLAWIHVGVYFLTSIILQLEKRSRSVKMTYYFSGRHSAHLLSVV